MRMERVNQQIKRELGMMLQLGEIKDPRVKFVTIQTVDTSKDLQHARVRFSILSDDPKVIQAATEGLNNSRGFIRREIAKRVILRYTPEFTFFYDNSIQRSARVEAVLAEIEQLPKAKEDSDVAER